MILSFCLASVGGLALALTVATAQALAVQCGDTVTSDTVLNADLTCACKDFFSVLTVEGPATLDLNGHTVSCGDFDFSLSHCLSIRGNGATIKNGKVSGCYFGVGGYNTTDGFVGALIKDIVTSGHGVAGIYMYGKNNILQNVTAMDYNYGDGIDVFGNNNSLYNVRATGNSECGIYVVGDNNQVKDSYVAGSALGIQLSGINNTAISNTVEDIVEGSEYIAGSCIAMYGGVGHVVKNNTVRRCRGFGAYVYANNAIIADNDFNYISKASIYASGLEDGDRIVTGTKITGNQIANSGADGIVLGYAQKMVVDNNFIVDIAGNGIVLLRSAARCTVDNNTISKCSMAGLRITGGHGNNVTDNEISSCKTGIHAGLGSMRNRLIDNHASNNSLFDLSDSSDNCGSNVWKGNSGKGNIACTTNEWSKVLLRPPAFESLTV